jgi:hypothetical protein
MARTTARLTATIGGVRLRLLGSGLRRGPDGAVVRRIVDKKPLNPPS